MQPPADIEELLDGIAGDRALLAELVDGFRSDYQTKLARVGESLHRGDAGSLEKSAHSLRGTLALFRARAATELAWKLEIMGREGRSAGALELYETLVRETETVVEYLSREVPRE